MRSVACNFTPYVAGRFVCRRLFDFLGDIDTLIRTIVLARAVGLGPLTGFPAILLTDTGMFGRLFSEALEKVGIKQVDDKLWLANFMTYDLGYFDEDACRLEPIEDPFGQKVLPMSRV